MIILNNRAIIAITGKDRYDFLNDINCNNVHQLKQDDCTSVWLAFLTPQGRYGVDCFAFCDDTNIYCDVDYANLNYLGQFLQKYHIGYDIEITPILDAQIIADDKKNNVENALCYRDPRHDDMGWRYCLFNNNTEILEENIRFDEYEDKRIALSLIDGSRDLSQHKNYLLEAGFHELNAIDWQKGCYIGQELTARLYHRGGLRGRFLPLNLSENKDIKAGLIIYDNEVEVGEITSLGQKYAICYLKMNYLSSNNLYCIAGGKKQQLKPFFPDWFDKDIGVKK